MSEPTSNKSSRIKSLHRHLWCVLAIWSGMFFANEAYRIYVTNQILKSAVVGSVLFAPRYPALEKSPAFLWKIAETLGGEHWNEDLVSVLIEHPVKDEEFFVKLGRLPRLSNLHIRGEKITPDDVRHIAAMRQLQYVYLLHTGVGEEATEQLRADLPNAFVVVF